MKLGEGNLSERIEKYLSVQEELEKEWDSIIQRLKEESLLEWSGTKIDGAEIYMSGPKGLILCMYTHSYGGDHELVHITWEQLRKLG